MEVDIKRLIQQLTTIQDKAQEVDNLLNDIRVKINDVIWDLMEIRKSECDKTKNST